MAVYARSDLMGVAIPAENGGCGQNHTRPVVAGAPAKVWKLACPVCEAVIREEITRDTLTVYHKDARPTTRNVGLWSDSELRIPLTPDEEDLAADMEREGKTGVAKLMEGMASAALAEQRRSVAYDTEQSVSQQRATDAEQRVQELEREMAEMKALIRSASEPVIKPVTPMVNPAKVVVPAACPSCGGALRKPGARGPAPKVCADCKTARVKV